jgi:hypothetical protein
MNKLRYPVCLPREVDINLCLNENLCEAKRSILEIQNQYVQASIFIAEAHGLGESA